MKKVLAIETSCDDTAVAIVQENAWVEISLIFSQIQEHLPFGGVVPEIAGRKHTLCLLPTIEEALKRSQNTWADIDGLAVTNRPGLLTSLFVGLITAKTLAICHKKPCLGVNHLEAHLYAPFLKDEDYTPPSWSEPFLALAISGGHTHLYKVHEFNRYELLGKTLDDAAGEAYDKFAKKLGLGFPGGVVVDRLSQKAQNPHKYPFPRPLIREDRLDFSFSGLKTAAQNTIHSMSEEEKKENLPDLCASFQEAVCEVLLSKLQKAQERSKLENVVLTGGVSANLRLRQLCQNWAQEKGLNLAMPPLRYCTDNAAMVGLIGIKRLKRWGGEKLFHLKASSQVKESDFF